MTQTSLDLFLNRAQQKIALLSTQVADEEQAGNEYDCLAEMLNKLIYTCQTLSCDNDLTFAEKDFLMQKITQECELWVIPYLIGISYTPASFSSFSGSSSGTNNGVHNNLTGLQGGNDTERYHLDLSDYNYLKGLRFTAPSISFPGPNYSGQDGAELGFSFDYVSNINVVPNDGTITSIKVFITTSGVENTTPIIDTLSTSFTLTQNGLTANTSYRLEVKYLNQASGSVTVNTTRSVAFYVATYYGVGVASLNETGIKLLTKIIVAPKNLDLTYTTSNNKIYFAELKSTDPDDRKVFDVALEYTTSFIKTDVTFTNGTASPLMRVYEFINNVIPSTFTFHYLR